jgi:hypothetical protein
VSKVATSAVCGMFERREGAAPFNQNNPGQAIPGPFFDKKVLTPIRIFFNLLRVAAPQSSNKTQQCIAILLSLWPMLQY